MSKISIIIPYFRKKKFIKKTLNSVINQTYKNIEIILIYDDDKKQDLNYIKELIKIDKRIKLIINKKNIGAGNSRNKGILNSKGKFISFIDQMIFGKKINLKNK
jgi:teichuronic acid biosynthesis glycosyltransferase TuaG